VIGFREYMFVRHSRSSCPHLHLTRQYVREQLCLGMILVLFSMIFLNVYCQGWWSFLDVATVGNLMASCIFGSVGGVNGRLVITHSCCGCYISDS
jgi:hypothetical protein